MEETKVTPGPWEVKASTDGSGDYAIVAPGIGIVAEVFGAIRNRDERSSEALYNAHAIAATLELRAALEEIADPISFMRRRAESEGKSLDGLMCVHMAESPEFLRGIARAALAKARGEAQ